MGSGGLAFTLAIVSAAPAAARPGTQEALRQDYARYAAYFAVGRLPPPESFAREESLGGRCVLARLGPAGPAAEVEERLGWRLEVRTGSPTPVDSFLYLALSVPEEDGGPGEEAPERASREGEAWRFPAGACAEASLRAFTMGARELYAAELRPSRACAPAAEGSGGSLPAYCVFWRRTRAAEPGVSPPSPEAPPTEALPEEEAPAAWPGRSAPPSS